ncbi:MAG: Uma2 family endonuclease [Thiolinea sp.]
MQVLKSHVTREEYLEIDAASDLKHEFYQGEIFAMSGGTFNHSAISTNVTTALQNLLNNSSCRPMNSDMRVSTPSGLDTYPDVSVFCGEPELTDKQRTLLNPIILIEVLSPTTKNYDRGDKFLHYRSIPELRDYLLIDSESVHIEHFQRRDENEWLFHEYRDADAQIYIKSIDRMLVLAEVYAQVSFENS